MAYPPDQDIAERAFRFTCKLFDYCDDVAQRPGPRRRLANQLFDAGSSIGANLEESKAAYSRRELASKNGIALKESWSVVVSIDNASPDDGRGDPATQRPTVERRIP